MVGRKRAGRTGRFRIHCSAGKTREEGLCLFLIACADVVDGRVDGRNAACQRTF